MSSFPAGSISSSLNFDTASWTGGFGQVVSAAGTFPALVAGNLDAPMAATAAAIGQHAAEAGHAIAQSIAQGVAPATAAMGQLPPAMAAVANEVSASAAQAGQSISSWIPQSIPVAQAAIAQLPPAMAAASHQMAASSHEAGQSIEHEIESGMLGAEATMRLFPPLVIELIENPILGAVAAGKEALEGLFEVMEGTAERFHKIGLASEKSGLDPEVFSTYAAAAKASGIDVEQFGNAIKFMSDLAANALRGDAGGAKAFEDLGISAQELAKLMEDPKEMLLRVSGAISAIENPALRTQAAMDLMSRAGVDMLPFLAKGPEEIQKLAAELGSLGAGVSESQVKMGEGWGLAEAKFDAMWMGIKTSLGQPILEFLEANMESILGTAKEIGTWLKSALTTGVAESIPMWQTVAGLAGGILDVAESLAPVIELIGILLKPVETLLKLVLDVASVGAAGLGGIINSAVHGADSSQSQRSFDRVESASMRLSQDIGFTDPPPVTVNANITLDSDKTSTDIARKLHSAVREVYEQLHRDMQGHAVHAKVARAMGGRR